MTTNTTITPELLDQLIANYEKPEDLTGDGGLFKQLRSSTGPRTHRASLPAQCCGRSRKMTDRAVAGALANLIEKKTKADLMR
jgi:hypothetical protein